MVSDPKVVLGVFCQTLHYVRDGFQSVVDCIMHQLTLFTKAQNGHA